VVTIVGSLTKRRSSLLRREKGDTISYQVHNNEVVAYDGDKHHISRHYWSITALFSYVQHKQS